MTTNKELKLTKEGLKEMLNTFITSLSTYWATTRGFSIYSSEDSVSFIMYNDKGFSEEIEKITFTCDINFPRKAELMSSLRFESANVLREYSKFISKAQNLEITGVADVFSNVESISLSDLLGKSKPSEPTENDDDFTLWD
jgi:hypothetical protein